MLVVETVLRWLLPKAVPIALSLGHPRNRLNRLNGQLFWFVSVYLVLSFSSDAAERHDRNWELWKQRREIAPACSPPNNRAKIFQRQPNVATGPLERGRIGERSRDEYALVQMSSEEGDDRHLVRKRDRFVRAAREQLR